METLLPIVGILIGKSGALAAIIAWVGTLRMFFKPVTSAMQSVAALPPPDATAQKANEVVNKALTSKWYKILVFILDLLGSIKLPKP